MLIFFLLFEVLFAFFAFIFISNIFAVKTKLLSYLFVSYIVTYKQVRIAIIFLAVCLCKLHKHTARKINYCLEKRKCFPALKTKKFKNRILWHAHFTVEFTYPKNFWFSPFFLPTNQQKWTAGKDLSIIVM